MKVVLRKLILIGLSFALIITVVLVYRHFSVTGPSASSQMENRSSSRRGNWESFPESMTRISRQEKSFQRGQKLEILFRGPGGRVEREYHAQNFKLISEDRADLKDVKLIWYLKDGKTLTLTSQRGSVHIEHGALGRAQPTRGLLTGNVKIVHDTRPQTQPAQRTLGQRDASKLIITTDKLDFDVPSCRLATDQPVELHGSRLDVYGTGLLLRWREISKDIDSLTITQGGEMIWYPESGGGLVSLTATPQEQKPQTPAPLAPIHSKEKKTQATTTPLLAKPLQEKKPQTTATLMPEPPEGQVQDQKIHSYLANFQRNVRVTYKELVLENVDILNVVFDLDTSDESDSTAEVSQPSPQDPSQTRTPRPLPNAAAEPQAPDSTTSKGEPTTEPDETSLQVPVRITWTGKLNIIPKENKDYQPTDQRRFEVEALGAPVELSSGDMSGKCARLTAQHQLGTAQLYSSPDFGVLLNAADGSIITADELNIDSNTSTAVMIGKGTLKSDAKKNPATSPDTSAQASKALDLSWNSQATLKFLKDNRLPAQPGDKTAPATTKEYYLSEATAIDDVVAVSDKFRAQANHMYIKLGPPGSDGTTQGQEILLLQAKDDFFSTLGQDGLNARADSMETYFTRRSSGKGQFPSTIELAGYTKITQKLPNSDTQSVLKSDQMLITLVEDNKVTASDSDSYGGSTVSKVLATHNVIGQQIVDGQVSSSFLAQKLERDEATKATLLYGDLAKLKRGHDTFESKIIRIVEKDAQYVLSAPGAGHMETSVASAQTNSDPEIVELDWPGSMVFDERANKAVFNRTANQLITGSIVHSPQRFSAFEAQQLELLLRDNKPTQAEELHSFTTPASDESFAAPTGSKSLQKMVLTGKAMVKSEEQTLDAPKKRLRSALLTSEVLIYLVDEGRFQGQGSGTLLLLDERPTDKQVSDEGPNSPPQAPAPKPRKPMRLHRVGPGQTAFEWTDSVDYDQAKRTAILLGNVYMISRGYSLTLPAKPSEQANAPNQRDLTQLWANELTVIHAQSKTDEASPKDSGFADLAAMDELEIESIKALGNKLSPAELRSSDVYIKGQTIFYSTKTNEIIITGTRKRKAILDYIDPEKGWGSWTGKTVRYNTLTHTGSAPSGKFNTVR